MILLTIKLPYMERFNSKMLVQIEMSEVMNEQAKAGLTAAVWSRSGCYNYGKTQKASMVS